jgi:hypothetical protein
MDKRLTTSFGCLLPPTLNIVNMHFSLFYLRHTQFLGNGGGPKLEMTKSAKTNERRFFLSPDEGKSVTVTLFVRIG